MFVWLDNIGIFQHTYSRPQKFSKEFTPGNLLYIRNGLEKACTCMCMWKEEDNCAGREVSV